MKTTTTTSKALETAIEFGATVRRTSYQAVSAPLQPEAEGIQSATRLWFYIVNGETTEEEAREIFEGWVLASQSTRNFSAKTDRAFGNSAIATFTALVQTSKGQFDFHSEMKG